MHRKKIFFISLVSGISIATLYSFGLVKNLRSVLSDLVTFNAAILGFLMVFFTVLKSIQNSELIKDMTDYSPNLIKNVFLLIKNLLMNSLFLFLYIIAIKITPNFQMKNLNILAVFFLFFKVSSLLSGFYFLISDLYNTLVQAKEN